MSEHPDPSIPHREATPATEETAKAMVSPGEMLQRAREGLNLTLADLAGQTRLSRAVLEALERNDFASLAMPVYVRGYFRKCAHVLNLPEDRLLQAYADWTGTPLAPQPLPVTIKVPPREYASPNRTPSWRYVLVIAVVAGALLWWFSSGELSTVSETPSGAAGVTTLEMPAPVVPEGQPLPLPLEAEAGAVAVMTPDPAVAGTLPSPTGGAISAATTDVAVAGPTAPVSGQAPGQTSDAVVTPAPAASPESAAPPVPAAAPPGPNTLQLVISQASWVEVYDDDGKRLLYGLLRPGDEQRVSGALPYQVVLGHPQGVKLSLGNRVIDLAPYTNDSGTARFKVKAP